MSNLIITIIAIALVAATAAIGTFYGGGAFFATKHASLAGQLISDGTTIKSGYILYSADNPANPSVDLDDLWTGPVTDRYVEEQVLPTAGIQINATTSTYEYYTTGGRKFAILDMGTSNQVCLKLEQHAGRTAIPLVDDVPLTKKFGCFQVTATAVTNLSTVLPGLTATQDFVFYVRIGG